MTEGGRPKAVCWRINHKERKSSNSLVENYKVHTVMGDVNIRLFSGGFFVTANGVTSYEGESKRVTLYRNVSEVCYFEFVYWIKHDLGYSEVGEIWYRRNGFNLYFGRAKITTDNDIPSFLQSPEEDGYYHLYVVHGGNEVGERDTSMVDDFDVDNFGGCSDREDDNIDSDVELSDGDFDDESDDDLFASNVDYDINERVTKSLVGIQSNESELCVDEGVRDEGVKDVYLESDEDLYSSEDDLRSLDGSDDEGGKCYPVFNPDVDFRGKIELFLGQKFPSNIIFRKALRHYAVETGHNYYYLHNGKERVTAYCCKRCKCPLKKGLKIGQCKCETKKKCEFKIHARKVRGEETFQIRSFNPNHNCGHHFSNNKVTSLYLAEKYLQDWKENPNWDMSAYVKRVNRECQCEVGYFKCYYSKQIAMRMLYGDASDEYARVWDYAEAIRKHIPGSTAIVTCTGIDNPPVMFQRMYICLQPCKEGFVAGCRPIIGVDGAHLKGPFPAVGKDGNQNIFPIAWAVVETENIETWSWFLELLTSDLQSVATPVHEKNGTFTFMSDRQKGLVEAFDVVVPNCETRYCCRHIWANFKKKFSGQLFRHHFWKAARASTKVKFDQQMECIKAIYIEAFDYLDGIPTKHWSRHAFTTLSRSGMLLNNCCESFNNVLREARSNPILSLMEWMRRYVMQRSVAKNEGLNQLEGELMPSVQKMMQFLSKHALGMKVISVGVYEFEVDDDDDTYVVNLQIKMCDCYRWSLLGIPCAHAMACINKKKLDYEEFVHKYYYVSTYAAAYKPDFHGMPGQKHWPKTSLPQPMPPPFKKLPGRPSKRKRVKEHDEYKDGEGKKIYVQLDKKQKKCTNCGLLGHYKTTCKNPSKPLTLEPKRKPGRPKKVAIGTTEVPSVPSPPPATSTVSQTNSKKAGKNKKKPTKSLAIQSSQHSSLSTI